MIECFLFLCLEAIYLQGSAGLQHQQDDGSYFHTETNLYGEFIGEASMTIEFENGLFIKAEHISGLNTSEVDGGLNSIMIGAKVYLFKRDQQE